MPLTTIFTVTPVGSNNDAGITYRLRCRITGGGQKIQISLKTINTGLVGHATRVSAGIWTGSNWDISGTPVNQTLVGATGFDVTATGQTIVLDETDLGTAFTSSDDLIVCIDWAGDNNSTWTADNAANCDTGFFTTSTGGSSIAAPGAPDLGSSLTVVNALVLIQAESAAGPALLTVPTPFGYVENEW